MKNDGTNTESSSDTVFARFRYRVESETSERGWLHRNPVSFPLSRLDNHACTDITSSTGDSMLTKAQGESI